MTETLPGEEGRHFVIVLDYSEEIQNTISIVRDVAKALLKLVTSRDKVNWFLPLFLVLLAK